MLDMEAKTARNDEKKEVEQKELLVRKRRRKRESSLEKGIKSGKINH